MQLEWVFSNIFYNLMYKQLSLKVISVNVTPPTPSPIVTLKSGVYFILNSPGQLVWPHLSCSTVTWGWWHSSRPTLLYLLLSNSFSACKLLDFWVFHNVSHFYSRTHSQMVPLSASPFSFFSYQIERYPMAWKHFWTSSTSTLIDRQYF